MRKTIFKKLEAQGLIANYNRYRKNLPSKLPERVYIWDETLREGVQTPTVYLTYVEKVKLAKMLDEIGVFAINVGLPAISEEERNDVRKIANESFQQAKLSASAGIDKSDVDACLQCGIKEILVVTPFNGLNLQYRLKMKREQVLEKVFETVDYAKKHGANVNFVLEDATRTPMEEILQILKTAIEAGASRINIADTAGFLRPLSMRYLISHLRDEITKIAKKNVPLCIHCHNDFGLATANTLAAVEEGISYLHTCVAGFGERAGVAPMEEVAAALELLYNIDTGLDLKKLYRLAKLAEKAFALPVPLHKPIVGDNVFSYEAAEHVRGMISHPLIYEPFPPEIIDRNTIFYFGGQTKRQDVEQYLNLAGIKATPMQIEEIMRRIRGMQESTDKGGAQMIFYQIKKLTKDLLKGLPEEEFWNIVEQVTRQKPKLPTT